ncbi:hypothetical protein FS749_004011, partial [Ceratobasidium sp. UAMH 11750]
MSQQLGLENADATNHHRVYANVKGRVDVIFWVMITAVAVCGAYYGSAGLGQAASRYQFSNPFARNLPGLLPWKSMEIPLYITTSALVVVFMTLVSRRFYFGQTEARNSLGGTISRNMSLDEIIDAICAHGCQDITDRLKIPRSSSGPVPVFSGGLGDIYEAQMTPNGKKVAVKCSRFALMPTDEARGALK